MSKKEDLIYKLVVPMKGKENWIRHTIFYKGMVASARSGMEQKKRKKEIEDGRQCYDMKYKTTTKDHG